VLKGIVSVDVLLKVLRQGHSEEEFKAAFSKQLEHCDAKGPVQVLQVGKQFFGSPPLGSSYMPSLTLQLPSGYNT